jgi:virginiamycin B lyase
MEIKGILSIIVIIIVSVSLVFAASQEVTIKEWTVPSANTFPHDPAVAPDGALWYTGIMANTVGRLDSKIGTIKEYHLLTPDSGPHGLAVDKDGIIWFTANYKGYIGKLNPATGEVKEYPMPDRSASDPHSLVIDQKGIIWFTVQRGNFVGRLDPITGRIQLKHSPSPNSLPYGIALNSKQNPFFCEFGTNKIAEINPDTFDISEYMLPEGARPRRIVVTPDDLIYYTDYARGILGSLNPGSRKIREWTSPGGSKSKPYAITATQDGIIWYSESGVTPNTVVRFDPKVESFSTWAIPSGGGVVRNMVATKEGELYLACSGQNRVAIVHINK